METMQFDFRKLIEMQDAVSLAILKQCYRQRYMMTPGTITFSDWAETNV